MSNAQDPAPLLHGDPPAAASADGLPDRNALATIAVERTRMPMVIADAPQPDHPIVLANQAFRDLTGYAADEVIGRNCRFLQGKGTAPATIAEIHAGLADGCGLSVEILNY